MFIKLMLSGKKQVLENKHKKITWLAIGVLGICVVLGIASIYWFYADRALPNVYIGEVYVGQKTPAEIEGLAQKQQAALQITFVDDAGKRTTVPAKDIGLVIDAKATTANALQARRTGSLAANLQIWSSRGVPLVFRNDPGILKEYIRQHYASVFADAKDAQLSYNDMSHTFDITPGTNGKGFDIKKFESVLPDLALRPRTVTMTLSSTPVEPLIQPKGLMGPQTEINKQIETSIQFAKDGKVAYKATPADIASWAHFTPDAVKGTVTIEFDKAKIQQFIDQQVSPKVTVTPIDRKVVIDKQTGAQTVLAAGRAGWRIKDADRLADNVLAALAAHQPLDAAISVEEAPIKTVTLTGSGKWIEIDLSQQKVTLYAGDTAVQNFLISSGKARTPTEIGEFRIYAKTPSQTMTGTIAGDYFYLPNVKWVSFFDGDEAFHGTYWHHNFGHPMSHGCINMTEADAKVLYDFAPVGTKVIVHQ